MLEWVGTVASAVTMTPTSLSSHTGCQHNRIWEGGRGRQARQRRLEDGQGSRSGMELEYAGGRGGRGWESHTLWSDIPQKRNQKYEYKY